MSVRGRAPHISIVLPTHRGGTRLLGAVDAIVAQTRQDWELILVDDGSDDAATATALDSASRTDPRVRRLRHERNRGLPAALNTGFAVARGHLFSWVADDDRPDPEAFAVLADRLDNEPGIGLVYGGFRLCDESGRRLRSGFSGPPSDLLSRGNVVGTCFLYRREVHDALGGYREQFALAEDYDFFLRAWVRFGALALERELGDKLHHPNSLTARYSIEASRVTVAMLEAFRREHPRAARRAAGRLHSLMARYAERGGIRDAVGRYLLAAAVASPLAVGARWADLRWWWRTAHARRPNGQPGR